jgi:hypothetical protein
VLFSFLKKSVGERERERMLSDSFDSDTFDSVKWINDNISSSSSSSSIDHQQHISTLIMKLQILAQVRFFYLPRRFSLSLCFIIIIIIIIVIIVIIVIIIIIIS